MDFDSLYLGYITEFTVADAGLAGDADFSYNSGDTYAPGDARIPKALGATISRKGKVKKKRKKKLNENKSIHDYLILPPQGKDEKI